MSHPDSFHPAWWCRGAHPQTLWAALLRPVPTVPLQRERWETPDGDFLDIDRKTRRCERSSCRQEATRDFSQACGRDILSPGPSAERWLSSRAIFDL